MGRLGNQNLGSVQDDFFFSVLIKKTAVKRQVSTIYELFSPGLECVNHVTCSSPAGQPVLSTS